MGESPIVRAQVLLLAQAENIGAGGFLAFIGGIGLVSSALHILPKLMSGAGVGLGLTGLFQMYRGLTLYSAFAKLKKARKIEKVISKVPVKQEAQKST